MNQEKFDELFEQSKFKKGLILHLNQQTRELNFYKEKIELMEAQIKVLQYKLNNNTN